MKIKVGQKVKIQLEPKKIRFFREIPAVIKDATIENITDIDGRIYISFETNGFRPHFEAKHIFVDMVKAANPDDFKRELKEINI